MMNNSHQKQLEQAMKNVNIHWKNYPQTALGGSADEAEKVDCRCLPRFVHIGSDVPQVAQFVWVHEHVSGEEVEESGS